MTNEEQSAPAQVVPTNEEIAQKIGLSHSGVSRIRNGHRLPGIETMQKIQEVYGWSVQTQVDARSRGTYAAEFEIAVASKGHE